MRIPLLDVTRDDSESRIYLEGTRNVIIFNELQTDIYSLGCVMFELLVGRAPYRKQGGLIAIFHHATKVRFLLNLFLYQGCEPLPAEEANFYSAECIEFLNKLTKLNPADRPDATTLLKVRKTLQLN